MRHSLPKVADELGEIPFRRVREAEEQAVRALEHRARADEAFAGDARGMQPGMRRPARVQALGPGAVGEILDDPARHAPRDSKRVHGLFLSRFNAAATASVEPIAPNTAVG